MIRTLRAWDQGRLHAVRRLASQWNLGYGLATVGRWSMAAECRLRPLRRETIDLAKESYIADLRAHQEQEQDTPAAQQAARRQQLMTRLKRLRPGASTALQAVVDSAGRVRQEPAEMARALGAHWAKVFDGKALNMEHVQSWLEEAYPRGEGLRDLPAPQDGAWRLRRRDVARAVKLAGKSAPGPDGIPYAAWQSLQAYGVDCLWEALQELSGDNAETRLEEAYWDEGGCHFNLGLLTCIPKQTTGVTAARVQYVAPADSRPISMVDTANRLLASAARLRWEVHLGRWICQEQRGFLPNRSLLANVVELEDEAMQTSLRESEGAMLLLDFAAAFPSISQQFLRAALQHVGFPPEAFHLVDALYYKNSCRIQVKGCKFDGFAMTGGIRQGCPLSPLLFIAAMDGLLRIITRKVAGAKVKAFADDTAVVLRSLKEDLPRLHVIFWRLERATGLQLNMRKCVLIPLGDRGPMAVRAYLERSGSPWLGVKVSTHGKYLGFEVGPERGTRSWAKPVEIAWDRIHLWDWSQLGLFFATQVWNVMVLSLFSFVSQLERPPQEVLAAETALLRKAAPGVGEWCRQSELHRLRRAYGFAGEYKDIASTAKAAQLRVVRFENDQHEGLELQGRAALLAAARRDTVFIDREWKWQCWYDAAHAKVLMANSNALRGEDVTTIRVEEQAAGAAARPWSAAVTSKVRRTFQKVARQLIQARDSYDALWWTRRKLRRWGCHDRREAERSLQRVRSLRGEVPPRVMAAAIGCVWNRWPTARRKQCRRSVCLLGCGCGEDSVEHYAGCRRSWEAARQWLGMEFRVSVPLLHWVYAAPTCVEVEHLQGWWGRVALLQYAVQKVTNASRRDRVLAEEEVRRALRQGLLEGARGHGNALALLKMSGRSRMPNGA